VFDDELPWEEAWEPPRDHVIDEAKATLLAEFFKPDATDVFYGRQLEIFLERRYFHWITKKALNELAQEKLVNSSIEPLRDQVMVHCYWPLRHRYPRRQIREIILLIQEYSTAEFAHALGEMGESLFDISMARIGFHVLAKNVRIWNGKEWTNSEHNLDRVVSRDGVIYGSEIKNTLAYIGREELRIKLDMCRYFGLIPFFVARAAPKSYTYEIIQQGGFSWLWGDQFYPSLAGELAHRVRTRLGLPVRRSRELPDTALARFESWHKKRVGKAEIV
jgi:hypothetical protein